jgi:hypothetical protein
MRRKLPKGHSAASPLLSSETGLGLDQPEAARAVSIHLMSPAAPSSQSNDGPTVKRFMQYSSIT